MSEEIPYGYCHCGCGQKTSIAKRSRKLQGHVKGHPVRFILGHLEGMCPISEGERFGRLTVISKKGEYYICVCDCGKEARAKRYSLLNGRKRSCGCLIREVARDRAYKHGYAKNSPLTPTYLVWNGMRGRCIHPTNFSYKYYGGRGIEVCERWQSFENFLEDMGERPEGYSIERKNNNLGYFPKNCVWATRKEQARNTRNNRTITFQGKTQILADWATELGINQQTISRRLKRGWSVEDALFKNGRGKK